MNYLITALRWLLVSSANPQQVSLTVRAIVLAVVPFTMQAIGLVCTIGYYCYAIDPSWFEQAGDAIANVVFYALSLLSAVGVVWGIVRKIYRTVTGRNYAIK